MFGFALLNSATFFFSCPMKVGEPHCMSQYFRTTLPFLSVPCPWVELSSPPPPHAAAITDRDARAAASATRRRLVLAMVNSLGVRGGVVLGQRSCGDCVQRPRAAEDRCAGRGAKPSRGLVDSWVPDLVRRRGAAFLPSTT